MADTKITALTALTAADPANDVLPIVDVSDTTMAASGTTKKISVNNILGASGTATLASATITGDLTVKTNVLKVDTTNNRVGIGTASPAVLFHAALPAATFGEVGRFYDSSGNGISFTANASSGFNQITSTGAQPLIVNVNSSERYRLASDGVATWSNVGGVAGTAMTLNSTGLGVGVSPSYKLDVQGADNSIIAQFGGVSGRKVNFTTSANGGFTNGFFNFVSTSSVGAFSFQNASGTLLTIDSAGNVGIGVTPNTWTSTFKAIQHPAFTLSSYSTTEAYFSQNAYYDGGWKRVAAGYASQYLAVNSEHRFLTAGTSSAGSAISFTQAMTLDASGNLLVGKTANYGAGEIQTLQLKSSVIFASDNTGSASNRNWSIGTNVSGAGNMEWTISSTNTGFPNFAYRMQLTSAGAAYNSTGTWGTISDSRLKENISDARNYLADLLKLRVVKYSLKEEASAVATKLGLIAQEVEQVFPSLVEQSDVAYDGGDGIRTVKTSILVPMLLKAIQELTARVQTLETR